MSGPDIVPTAPEDPPPVLDLELAREFQLALRGEEGGDPLDARR